MPGFVGFVYKCFMKISRNSVHKVLGAGRRKLSTLVLLQNGKYSVRIIAMPLRDGW